ncbi:hypothetical protein ABIB38_002195 [Massilia sp. UYP11]
MPMLEQCHQQDLCHLASCRGKPFISKANSVIFGGRLRRGWSVRLPRAGTGAAHLPNHGA